jgi:fatty acid desaturase
MTDEERTATLQHIHDALNDEALRVSLLALDVLKRRQDLSTEWWKVAAALIGAIGAWGTIIALILRWPHGI